MKKVLFIKNILWEADKIEKNVFFCYLIFIVVFLAGCSLTTKTVTKFSPELIDEIETVYDFKFPKDTKFLKFMYDDYRDFQCETIIEISHEKFTQYIDSLENDFEPPENLGYYCNYYIQSTQTLILLQKEGDIEQIILFPAPSVKKWDCEKLLETIK